jgi:phosphoglycerate dehydrogenase-like enzyme
LKLVTKAIDNDGRLASLPRQITTDWHIVVTEHRNANEFATALADADAFITTEWLDTYPRAPKLKLLQLPQTGIDSVNFECVPPLASVCNAYEHETGIAEYVMAAMLEWLIGIGKMNAAFKRGDWLGSYLCGPLHGDLSGKTVAIIGYGRIGREIAKRAAAFAMRVVAASRTAKQGDEWCESVRGMNELKAVLAVADFVVCTLPLDESTRGIFDRDAFASMKPSAVIINVSRGAVIDEAALFEACKRKTIAGAIIDVWYQYPPQGGAGVPNMRPSRYAFHELENVVMTPHASAWTEALPERRCRIAATNLDRLARGEPFINLVRGPRQAG